MTPLHPATLAEWEQNKQALLDNLRFASAIDLLAHDAPLNPIVFGAFEFMGIVIEKVILQSLPGFYVTGNLFRPKDTSKKYPAVLNPHGHWDSGRLELSPLARIPQRCVNQALRGMVAFAYDMIGFNDATQLGHYDTIPGYEAYNVGHFSVQLNNSRKAVDFVSALPYVDADRIGCTGCSGGGTQTYFLAALDERVKVAAPINMASCLMQGGCICENTAFLRNYFCNIDYTMTIAPRPLFMAAADGDWTKHSETCEFPTVQNVYDLYRAGDNFEHYYHHAPHCYDLPVRERVYDFLCRKFGLPNPEPAEVDFEIDTNLLRVGDIRAHVPAQGYIDSEEKMLALLKRLLERNVPGMRQEQKDEWTRRIFALDCNFTLNVPYYMAGDALAGETPVCVFGGCPAATDTCGAKYYHTYNTADDTKHVSALYRFFAQNPDMPYRAEGKTAVLCAVAQALLGRGDVPSDDELASLQIPGIGLWAMMNRDGIKII